MAFKWKPSLENSCVFGSQGYAHIDVTKRTKLDHHSFCSMFLGYAKSVKGYRVVDLETSKVKGSRSVKLDERKVGSIYDKQLPQL